MKSRKDYPIWFYFHDEEDDYDEDGYYYKKEKDWIDYEGEEDEREITIFNFLYGKMRIING